MCRINETVKPRIRVWNSLRIRIRDVPHRLSTAAVSPSVATVDMFLWQLIDDVMLTSRIAYSSRLDSLKVAFFVVHADILVRDIWRCLYMNCLYVKSVRTEEDSEGLPVQYIGWQWRTFFISAVFRHFVGQHLRNVCCSDVSRRHFLNKIAIVRHFLKPTASIWFE